MEEKWAALNGEKRSLAKVNGELESAFFENPRSKAALSSQDSCPVTCLSKGTPKDFILTPPEYMVYSGKRDSIKFQKYSHSNQDYETSDEFNSEYPLQSWIVETCQRVEIGWTSYMKNEVAMYWVRSDGSRVEQGNLQYGEKKTIWQTTTLGHRFILEDSVTKEVLDDYIIEHEGFRVVGSSGSMVGSNRSNPVADIRRTLDAEWGRRDCLFMNLKA